MWYFFKHFTLIWLMDACQTICPNSPSKWNWLSTHIHMRQWGKSVLPKDTITYSDEAGFKPPEYFSLVRIIGRPATVVNRLSFTPDHEKLQCTGPVCTLIFENDLTKAVPCFSFVCQMEECRRIKTWPSSKWWKGTSPCSLIFSLKSPNVLKEIATNAILSSLANVQKKPIILNRGFLFRERGKSVCHLL